MGYGQDYAGDLRSLADNIEGMEESYDNMVAELREVEEELERANDTIEQMQKYIDWAEAYYKNMKDEYAAICAVRG
jgi:chromosome segregation ATPase